MRKFLCFIAAAVTVTACACGKGASDPADTGPAAAEIGTGEENTAAGETESRESADAGLPPELETAPEDVDFQTGTWDGLTFSNPWLGLTVTLPEGSYVCKEEDIQAIVGAGQDILINSGSYTDMEMKIADAVTVYDFIAALPDGQSTVQLAYENVRLTTRGEGISAADYLDVVWQQLSSVGSLECRLETREETVLAGQTFARLSVNLMEGSMYQDYYSICRGSHMAVFTISYIPESSDMIRELMEGIRQRIGEDGG